MMTTTMMTPDDEPDVVVDPLPDPLVERLHEELDWVLRSMEDSVSQAEELEKQRQRARDDGDVSEHRQLDEQLLWLGEQVDAFSHQADQLRDRLRARLTELGMQP